MESQQQSNDNFIRENNNIGAPVNKRWHQLMAECELRIRYSTRRARYILEIVSLDVMEVHQEPNNNILG